MKGKKGQVFSVSQDNRPLVGCTISDCIHSDMNDIVVFSLAKDTDISAEIYPYHKFLIVHEGQVKVYGYGSEVQLKTGDCLVCPVKVPVGMAASEDSVYTEITISRGDHMNKAINVGEVFRLADLVQYREGKIVNMDIVHNEKMKFVVMAFGAGTGLSEHSAPGEAMIFALDGEAVIGYEGVEHTIKAGENFCFAKEGLHSVKADKNFKMALLLTL